MNKNTVILDASALLAFINQEKGAEIVHAYFPNVIMSAVNVSEVATLLHHMGSPIDEITTELNELLQAIIPFETDQIFITASLRAKTRHLGLSFADRACLALGLLKKQTVITADQTWEKLDLGVKLKFIR